MRGNVLAVSYGVLKCSHRAGTVQDSASAHTTLSLNSFLFAVSVFPDLWIFFSTPFIFVYFLCFVVPLFSFALFFLCLFPFRVCISLLSTWKLSMGYIFHIFVPVFLVNVSWLLFLSVAMSVLSGYVHFTVTRSVFVVNVWGVVTCCNVHIKLKWTPCYSVSIWLKCPSFCCDVMSRRNVHLL